MGFWVGLALLTFLVLVLGYGIRLLGLPGAAVVGAAGSRGTGRRGGASEPDHATVLIVLGVLGSGTALTFGAAAAIFLAHPDGNLVANRGQVSGNARSTAVAKVIPLPGIAEPMPMPMPGPRTFLPTSTAGSTGPRSPMPRPASRSDGPR